VRGGVQSNKPDVGKTFEMTNDPTYQDTDSLTEEKKLKCLGCGFVNVIPLMDKMTVVFGSIGSFLIVHWFVLCESLATLQRQPWDDRVRVGGVSLL
jgi:hypothetical protein